MIDVYTDSVTDDGNAAANTASSQGTWREREGNLVPMTFIDILLVNNFLMSLGACLMWQQLPC